ncbi:MAG: hypothetical protein JWO08_919 [Verrucomicrobiaceae bacterium]|nr:hypothetical protein [Verrucomicrobiaceae bacterium]
MNNKVEEVQVRAVVPLEGSFAVFLGNEEKTFVIYVDEPVGMAISMFMRGISKERPLTHDLMASLLLAFGAKVERAVINDVNGSVFYARLIIAAENQLHTRKLIELDARPSDSIALAMHQGAPVFVARKVLDTVEDMSEALEQIEKRGLDAGSGKPSKAKGEEEDEDLEEDEDDDDDDDFTEDDLFTDEDDDDDDDEFEDDEDEEEEDEKPPGR